MGSGAKDQGDGGTDGGPGADTTGANDSDSGPSSPPAAGGSISNGAPRAEGEVSVKIDTDEDGNGSAMIGLDADTVRILRCSDPDDADTIIDVQPSHTIGITRIGIENSPTKSGAVIVTVSAN